MLKKAFVKDYEQLAKEFGQNLLTKLRQHSVDYGFLDYWVADSDFKKGLISMVESAKLSNYGEIDINFKKKSLAHKDIDWFKNEIIKFGNFELTDRNDSYNLLVKFLDKKELPIKISNKVNKVNIINKVNNHKNIESNSEVKINEFYIKDKFQNYIDAVKLKPKSFLLKENYLSKKNYDHLNTKFKEIELHCFLDKKTKITKNIFFKNTSNQYLNYILEEICIKSQNLPIQEISEHILLKVIKSLDDHSNNFVKKNDIKKRGILLPKNCGTIFVDIQKALRQLFLDYCELYNEKFKINFFYNEPNTRWNKLRKTEKINTVNSEIVNFINSKGVNVIDYVKLVDIKSNKYNFDTRCIIKFSDNIEPNKKPKILRELESYVRDKIDTSLEIIAEKLKDTSPLRRL